MYASLARFGYGIAKSLKPDNIKKLLSPALEKVAKPAVMGKKMSKGKATFNKGIRGAANKGYKGYTKAYDTTLGTSTRRKVTSGVIGGYGLSSFLDEDDNNY